MINKFKSLNWEQRKKELKDSKNQPRGAQKNKFYNMML